jgi:hypothetical protein
MIFLDDDNTNSEIFIPPVACNFRNNCKDANWQFDSEIIGKDGSEFLFFAYAPYFGDMGDTHQNKNWGQVWGYPLNSEMPSLVFVTYLKTSGLQSFTNQWNSIKSQDKKLPDGKIVKKNPSRFVWRSRFKPAVKVTKDGPGQYFLLLWETEELEENSERYQLAEKCERDMKANIARLSDPAGTARMIKLLGKSDAEKEEAIAKFLASKNQQLPTANNQQLAPAS